MQQHCAPVPAPDSSFCLTCSHPRYSGAVVIPPLLHLIPPPPLHPAHPTPPPLPSAPHSGALPTGLTHVQQHTHHVPGSGRTEWGQAARGQLPMHLIGGSAHLASDSTHSTAPPGALSTLHVSLTCRFFVCVRLSFSACVDTLSLLQPGRRLAKGTSCGLTACFLSSFQLQTQPRCLCPTRSLALPCWPQSSSSHTRSIPFCLRSCKFKSFSLSKRACLPP